MRKLCLLIFILLPLSLFPLSLEKGNLRIVVNNDTGGFICYGRSSETASWYSLFVESFTSSYLQLSVNGDIHFLSGNDDYVLSYKQGDDWVTIIYESTSLHVEEKLTLVAAEGESGHINVEISVYNRGEETLDLGVKRVLDTNFTRGESHFYVEGFSIESETTYEEGSIPILFQATNSTGQERLYVQPYSSDSDRAPLPNRVLLVNWNRIDTMDWDYIPAEGTNFNSLPFSINDSAIGLYWLPSPLKGQNTLYASYALSVTDFTTVPLVEYAEDFSLQTVYTGMDPALVDLFIEEQLDYLDRLVQDIDRVIASGQGIENDDILVIEDRLGILKEKKRDYEELQ